MKKIFFLIWVLSYLGVDLHGQSLALNNIRKSSSEIERLQSKAFDMTTLLPKKFVTDASIDYTSFIQQALDKYKIVKMPNFPILINHKGLKVRSDSEIFFLKKSSLILMPNNSSAYAILDIYGQKNVKIYNANLIGDRFKHIGSIGEWGMGIRIMDSHNITLYSPSVKNCWGDGIYIGDDNNNKIYNKNIFLLNFSVIKSRRNGITIASGENVFINEGNISDSNGVMPKSGIDIEPNNNNSIINNIVINKINTNNEGAGIIVSLGKLVGKEAVVNINISDHYDNGGSSGLHISHLDYNAMNLSGNIIVKNSNYINNKTNAIFIENYAANNSPKILISDSKIINPNSSNQGSPRWGSGISVGRDSRKRVFNKMGNVQIKNISIVDNRPKALMKAAISFNDDNNVDFEKVDLSGIKVEGIKSSNQFNLKKGIILKK